VTWERLFQALLLLVAAAAAVLCFGPGYGERTASVGIALAKMFGLLSALSVAVIIVARLTPGDPQRRSWVWLSGGLLLYAAGQGVLAYHQIGLKIAMAFPSWGDPFFVISYFLLVPALVGFCTVAFRSGLPLGRPLLFVSPALAVGVLFVAGAGPLLSIVMGADEGWQATALNLFYPVASFITLAPCLIMLRVAAKFRGGSLLLVWGPFALGFIAVLLSDLLFAFLVSVEGSWFEPLMDWLYVLGYTLVPIGALSQARLLRRSPAKLG
jgi:hypothetical protein